MKTVFSQIIAVELREQYYYTVAYMRPIIQWRVVLPNPPKPPLRPSLIKSISSPRMLYENKLDLQR
jgi:hypothetical protein